VIFCPWKQWRILVKRSCLAEWKLLGTVDRTGRSDDGGVFVDWETPQIKSTKVLFGENWIVYTTVYWIEITANMCIWLLHEQENYHILWGGSTCDVERFNFLTLYVRNEPVSFSVNQRRGCSTVTRLCQLVTAEENLPVIKICWKIMDLRLNSLHLPFFEQVRGCSFLQQHSVYTPVRSFFILSFAGWLFIGYVFFYHIFYIIYTHSDLHLNIYMKQFLYRHWGLQDIKCPRFPENLHNTADSLSILRTRRPALKKCLYRSFLYKDD
jgi:hypothetical protein